MAEPKSQIIEVTGIDKTATDALLKLHFSSRSHGGEIMRIYHIQGSENALIAFTSTEGKKYSSIGRLHLFSTNRG